MEDLKTLILYPLVLVMFVGSFLLLGNLSELLEPQKKVNIDGWEKVDLNSYCKGWEDGWCEGWKYIKGDQALCPVAPICPVPEINRNTYKDGYNRGFAAGSESAKKSNEESNDK